MMDAKESPVTRKTASLMIWRTSSPSERKRVGPRRSRTAARSDGRPDRRLRRFHARCDDGLARRPGGGRRPRSLGPGLSRRGRAGGGAGLPGGLRPPRPRGHASRLRGRASIRRLATGLRPERRIAGDRGRGGRRASGSPVVTAGRQRPDRWPALA